MDEVQRCAIAFSSFAIYRPDLPAHNRYSFESNPIEPHLDLQLVGLSRAMGVSPSFCLIHRPDLCDRFATAPSARYILHPEAFALDTSHPSQNHLRTTPQEITPNFRRTFDQNRQTRFAFRSKFRSGKSSSTANSRSSQEYLKYDLRHTLGFIANPRRLNGI